MRYLLILSLAMMIVGCSGRKSASSTDEMERPLAGMETTTEVPAPPPVSETTPRPPAAVSEPADAPSPAVIELRDAPAAEFDSYDAVEADYEMAEEAAFSSRSREEAVGSKLAAMSYDEGGSGGGPGPTVERKKAGQLTAGEIHDFSKWELWEDLTEGELNQYQSVWKLYPEQRYSLKLRNAANFPLVDLKVELLNRNGTVVWTTRSDNLGQAELWAGMDNEQGGNGHRIRIVHEGEKYYLNRPHTFAEGVNLFQINRDCSDASKVEVAFVVDATGSMADEIQYLQAELADVVERIQDSLPDQPIRLGSVFYRDQDDEYVTRFAPLSGSITPTLSFLAKQSANGGGDYPEAVEAGLSTAIDNLEWSDEAAARLLFLVLDAPPHQDAGTVAEIGALVQKAAEKGIRIIPVTASGIDKSTEYLMRSMALATNGTYTFLTNHSGIGGHHIEPSTDSYEVELLNDLLTRLVVQFARTKPCDAPLASTVTTLDTVFNSLPADSSVLLASGDSALTTLSLPVNWKFFPNPTSGPFHLEVDHPVETIFLADMNGKLLRRIQVGRLGNETRMWSFDLSQFPIGTYLLQIQLGDGRKVSGRVIRI